MIGENNEDAYSLMIDKYQPLINKYADYYYRQYNNRGIEKDELVQEGIVGLINAINFYMNQDKCIFYTFAKLVIKREMERYIKRTMRNKQLILTTATSFSEPIGLDDLVIEDTLYNINDNVETIVNDNFYRKLLYDFKYELSFLQSQIYELRLNNFSNKEIAVLLDINYKSVDNCLRIMKSKFKNYIQRNL